MWDSWYERDTGMGDFEERDSGNNHLNKPRTGMSVDENLIVKKLIFSVREKYQANQRRSGCSATHFSYCVGMKIVSEAKLPIYQKSSTAHRVTRHLKLLLLLKCLTALKNLQQFSELYLYDAPNLLSLTRNLCGLRGRWLTPYQSKRTVYYLLFQVLFSTYSADVLTIHSINPKSNLNYIYYSLSLFTLRNYQLVFSLNHECSKFPSQPTIICLYLILITQKHVSVLHAISPISMKLFQFKGSTSKLKKTNRFLFWFFPREIEPPPRFFLVFTKEIASK